jgi:hypothetical protein
MPLAVAFQTGCHDLSAPHCECCTDIHSCPCATDGDQAPDRLPMSVLPHHVKLPAAKPCETRVSLEEARVAQTARRTHAVPAPEQMAGYAGVSLTVAFCSFLM